jgi:hypothetical protein
VFSELNALSLERRYGTTAIFYEIAAWMQIAYFSFLSRARMVFPFLEGYTRVLLPLTSMKEVTSVMCKGFNNIVLQASSPA